ncbi:MAG: adenylyl-sulfate reductase subunit alpha [Coriobacteriaceae bacterium]|nr:MAG: adenylyl-sulfate reductase subunit alpha [Coriobacteriaceae bacterium]
MRRVRIDTDVLVIGGGTAGCFAARTLGAHPEVDVVVVDKAGIERSGCLAAGVNAINAYITKGRTPEFYADYAMDDAGGIARWDLLISMSERLNDCAHALEDEGLVYLRNPDGSYAERGTRNVKINGENIKPLLARAARRQPNVRVLEHVDVTDLLVEDGKVAGAVGFSVTSDVAYELHARAVIMSTGGASGLYRPNNPGFSRHKMWYCPFDTGAGYAMGLAAGAEMTTFEMRFIALRCKDTIAPTGTIAQGVHAPQVNALGEVYENKYGLRTSERVWGTVEETLQGRGPCVLRTKGIGKEAERELYHAYLNMSPAQTLRWMEAGAGPDEVDVEIEGTEPYVVGGHTASGYWIDESRATTLPGLFAAGDVAGGAPQKYVTGALAEGQIAAESALAYLEAHATKREPAGDDALSPRADHIVCGYEYHLAGGDPAVAALFDADQLEEAMQTAMDRYAGGISSGYRYTEAGLAQAKHQTESLGPLVDGLGAKDTDDLLRIYELRERLVVCRALIAHLGARRETRWHAFAENVDHPGTDQSFACYVNSRMRDGHIETFTRPLVKRGEHLEHFDR